ncbi:hypothetical protein [Natronorubrum texcoconense]|uniref:Uncharacterized protein n=1 Tax=Natronorubrum texcoconense TaxID=1095776 RepID=A0A1G8ZTA0_9EURY|nr:hypothetical protein [Natronorubrum texcoconense]SDK17585.1 hypothetical protein SAMN04515672_2426 [Natronorubrum texcoconense]
MRAREWAIAGSFRVPADYDIPDLPSWRVRRNKCGGLAFADGDEEPFIAADRPVTVRR